MYTWETLFSSFLIMEEIFQDTESYFLYNNFLNMLKIWEWMSESCMFGLGLFPDLALAWAPADTCNIVGYKASWENEWMNKYPQVKILYSCSGDKSIHSTTCSHLISTAVQCGWSRDNWGTLQRLYSPKLPLFTACLPVSVTHLSAELLWAATAQKYNQQQQQHVCNYGGSFKKDRHNYLSAWTCLMFADIRLLVDLLCALPELWG